MQKLGKFIHQSLRSWHSLKLFARYFL